MWRRFKIYLYQRFHIRNVEARKKLREMLRKNLELKLDNEKIKLRKLISETKRKCSEIGLGSEDMKNDVGLVLLLIEEIIVLNLDPRKEMIDMKEPIIDAYELCMNTDWGKKNIILLRELGKDL